VGSSERILAVAERVRRTAQEGHRLVVVVSAMQGETDRLLGLAQSLTPRPSPRECDQLLATGEQASAALLAIALNSMGIRARSMTAPQMRLVTDNAFSRARIRRVDRRAVLGHVEAGEVVVATGFQGIDEQGNLTTLGRGGSDTSAVALAAGLQADLCEIYTDVLGVYTADPNICRAARKIDVIAFEEMLELASQGAKVLQIRSVELAMNNDVPVRVRSTFSDDPGTLVRDGADLERLVVRGLSHNVKEVKVTLRRVPDRPGIAAEIFGALAAAKINVDVIVQNASLGGTTDLSFTVEEPDRLDTEALVREVAQRIHADAVEVDADIAKVSIVGVGMRSHPGVAAAMFETLRDEGINIHMITTSEIRVTCVIARAAAERAIVALHEKFALGAQGTDAA
jgi:aspartate kinase